MTVADLLWAWLASLEGRRRPSTLATHRGYVTNRLVPRLGHLRLGELRAFHLDAAYGAWLAEGLAPGTVRRLHAMIRAALAQAVRWDLLATNPATRASPPSGRPRETPGVPDPAEVRGWLAAARAEDPVLALAASLAALSGARRGELCALRWSAVDRSGGTLLLGASLGRHEGRLVVGPTKTGRVRRIALGPAALRLVEEHQAWQRRRAAAVGLALPPDPYLLSYAPDAGRPVSPDTLTHRWRTLCGGRARFHDLRHFAATVALGAGVPVRDVAARLGHASASTTLDRYAHALPAGDQRAAAALEAALEPDPGGNDESARHRRSRAWTRNGGAP
jgi:integrase